MLVFREGKRVVAGRWLRDDLASRINRLNFARPSHDELTDALICAGELECALADKHQHSIAPSFAQEVTDALARQLVSGESLDCRTLLVELASQDVPAELTISPPEGFAYYGLHPLDFARATSHLSSRAGRLAVIGIRGIGTTLSAAVTAALGQAATRITVRPTGHPFDRQLHFTAAQRDWIRARKSQDCNFLIVDEGPGLSGSSLLSVGEALRDKGILAERITFVCSHQPDVQKLCAPNAAERWRAFHCLAASSNKTVEGRFIGNGVWREFVHGETLASWTSMERSKFLSLTGPYLWKFEGLGRWGEQARARAKLLADAGFSPAFDAVEGGCVRYPWLIAAGTRRLAASDLDEGVIRGLAEYCTFRVKAFRNQDGYLRDQLGEMVDVNLQEEFGRPRPHGFELRIQEAIVADGRMLPHEFFRTAEGEILKVDGVSHGDDHFFPGPTDIAWDLAGAIIEWDMSPAAADHFLTHYRECSGDDACARIRAFLLAYAAFRMGYCKMAAQAMAGSNEEARLRADYNRYSSKCAGYLRPCEATKTSESVGAA